jgi:hypothetical protein
MIERFIVTQFCDDIRQEVGNKTSLMGCYSGELLVEQLPAALPKLCAQVKIFTPHDKPFERLVVRAFLDADLIGELEVPVEQASRVMRLTDPMAARFVVGAIMTFAPFIVEREGAVRIEAETEEGALKGGRLRLLLAENYRRAQDALIAQMGADAPMRSAQAKTAS